MLKVAGELSLALGAYENAASDLNDVRCICCGLNLSLVYSFLNWFQFYLPLFQIMVMNTQQKKIKIEPVLKILHQN